MEHTQNSHQEEQIPVYTPAQTYTAFPPPSWQSSGEEKIQPKPVKKKKGKWIKRFFAVVFLCVALVLYALVVCASTLIINSAAWSNKYQMLSQATDNKIAALEEQIAGMKQNPGTSSGTVSEAPETGFLPAQVYEQNVRAVVAINSQGITTNIYGQISDTASSGSGFIISQDGYVVTNYHVIEGGNTVTVITNDSQEYEAKVVGFDRANDVAVLKIEAEGLAYVTLGSSDELQVGDRVAAIGNPLGELTSTMTVGYVSAKDRMVTTDGTSLNMLQTDCAINSGNSGGPLFNMMGQVVGITTAKYSGYSNSGASIEGISFAIPMDDVVGIIEDLRDYGYVTGAYLGVMIRDFDSSIATLYGLPAGVYVDSVVEGNCAEAAGVKKGDIIIDLGGYSIANTSDLSRALRRFEAGDETTITVFRNGAKEIFSITLDEKPQTNP